MEKTVPEESGRYCESHIHIRFSNVQSSLALHSYLTNLWSFEGVEWTRPSKGRRLEIRVDLDGTPTARQKTFICFC